MANGADVIFGELRALARAVRRLRVWRALFLLLAILGAFAALNFLVDRGVFLIWHEQIPRGVRLGAVLSMALLWGALTLPRLWRAWRLRLTARDAGEWVEARAPDLRGVVRTWLLLDDDERAQEPYVALLEAEVRRGFARRAPRALLRRGALRASAALLLAVAGFWCLAGAFAGETLSLWGERLVGDRAWPSRVRVALRFPSHLADGTRVNALAHPEKPLTWIVAHDSPLEVAAQVAPDSAWLPESAELRLEPGLAGRTRLNLEAQGERRWRWVFAPGISAQTVTARAGDAWTETWTILPAAAPRLNRLDVALDLPAAWNAQPVRWEGVETVPVVTGSQVTLTGYTDQVLADSPLLLRIGSVLVKAGVHPDDPRAFVARFDAPTPEARLELEFANRLGLGPTHPVFRAVKRYQDQAPTVTLTTPLLPLFEVDPVLEVSQAALPIRCEASDDLALRSLALTVRPAGAADAPPGTSEAPPAIERQPVTLEMPGARAAWTRARARIPDHEAEYEIRALAGDFSDAGERRTESAALRLRRVSAEALDRRLRDAMAEGRRTLRRARTLLEGVQEGVVTLAKSSNDAKPPRDTLIALERDLEAVGRGAAEVGRVADRVFRSMAINRGDEGFFGRADERTLVALVALTRFVAETDEGGAVVDPVAARVRRLLVPQRPYTGQEAQDRLNRPTPDLARALCEALWLPEWNSWRDGDHAPDPEVLPTDLLADLVWRARLEDLGLVHDGARRVRSWYRHPERAQGAAYFEGIQALGGTLRSCAVLLDAMDDLMRRWEGFELVRRQAQKLREDHRAFTQALETMTEKPR